MPCNQTLSGLVRDCEPSMGGIAEAYIANFADVTGVTVTTGKISAITMASTAKFKKYAFAKATGNFTSNYAINAENGTKYVETDILFVFTRMETAKRVEINALAQGDLCVIVKDNNGLYWFFGKDEPVTATAADASTGTARSDRNGYSTTLRDNSKEFPFEVDADIIEDIVAA